MEASIPRTEAEKEQKILDNMMPRLNLGLVIHGSTTAIDAFMDDLRMLKEKHPEAHLIFAHGTTNRIWMCEERDSKLVPIRGKERGGLRVPEPTIIECEEILPLA